VPAPVEVSQEAKDNALGFMVTAVADMGKELVENIRAQGTFLVVNAQVRNIGKFPSVTPPITRACKTIKGASIL
jgi:hypothetical protein